MIVFYYFVRSTRDTNVLFIAQHNIRKGRSDGERPVLARPVPSRLARSRRHHFNRRLRTRTRRENTHGFSGFLPFFAKRIINNSRLDRKTFLIIDTTRD